MIGLYSIKHKDSGKQYIGSSVDIKGRITTHLKMLRRNEHHCDHLQRAWNLYGESKFVLVPILQADTIEFIREIEQRYLDEFFGETLYNTNNKAIGAACGDASAAKRPDWHMKSVKERFTKEELLKIYGKPVKVGNTSINLYLEARSHSVYTGKQTVILHTQITFVRIDDEGNPIPISDRAKNRINQIIEGSLDISDKTI